jgi:UDP-N-acetylglucosamine--N-acetylmuramyl-(pentapeptide) pyrophosphoryl-undecaprenol N-acetylglucosamine transferase
MFPAQALAEAMLARGWRVALSTDTRGASHAGGFPSAVARRVVASGSFGQGGILARLAVPVRVAAGIVSALRWFRAERPACVAGFGGYPAIPALAAAGALGLPRLIHEQNAIPGRVNRLFARRVDRVACGIWPTHLPEGTRAVHVGNPVRGSVRFHAGAAYAPPGEGPLSVLVIGGSQGAQALSRLVPASVALLPEALRARLRIAQQVRPDDPTDVAGAYAALGVQAETAPFFADVPARLAAAQLVISRAGASSVADICAIGRPAILVPYPFAADDHQTANAAGLVTAGAAIAEPEAGLTAQRLAAHIAAILGEPARAAAMAAAARELGRPDAADRLADLVEELSGGGTR